MAINTHHIVEEIEGTRCSVVEKKIQPERAAFLTEILINSGKEVRSHADETGAVTLGVTDVTFNVLHALYARCLKTAQNKMVTPAMWYQSEQTGEFYWGYEH